MAAPIDVMGTTVTGDSSFFGQITSIGWSGLSRESLETTHTATATARTFIPHSLFDPGELEVEIRFDAAARPPFDNITETWTVDFSGAGTGNTWAASGFMTGFSVSGGLDDIYTASGTVKLSGDITIA